MSTRADAASPPLRGRTVVTTRERRGRLDRRLAVLGADVVHVPLIEILDPPDGGRALADALADLGRAAWLVVTSKHGARRVAAAAAAHPALRLAAVGTATADVLRRGAGRDVDLVPVRQTAADLLAAMPAPSNGGHVVVAQADRADPALAEGLSAAGWSVVAVTAYSTRLRVPSTEERTAALGCDAVAFASGSAVTAWIDAFGPVAPPHVVVIGPTTRAVATAAGLQVTAEAADHNLDGLADAVTTALVARP